MAGMWILLRDRGNRNILARAFDNGDDGATDTETRIAEAIQVHELAEEQQLRRESETGLPEAPIETPAARNPDCEDGEWGLASLVKVGETWLQGLLDAPAQQDANASILKLFEFLTASLCLFVIPDDTIPDQGPLQIYDFDPKKQFNLLTVSGLLRVFAEDVGGQCILKSRRQWRMLKCLR